MQFYGVYNFLGKISGNEGVQGVLGHMVYGGSKVSRYRHMALTR